MTHKPSSEYVEVDTSPERLSSVWLRVCRELERRGERVADVESTSFERRPWWQRRPWQGRTWQGRTWQRGTRSRLAGVARGGPSIWGAPVWWARLGAAAALAALVFFLWLPRVREQGLLDAHTAHVSVQQGARLETAGEPLAVAMDDGSHLQLSANTQLQIEQPQSEPVGAARDGQDPAHAAVPQRRVAVHLGRGKVQCDVARDPQRRFVVVANGVEVRVTGTSFSVEVSPDGQLVRVEVKSGTVEVAPPGSAGHERRLSAGESWSIDLGTPTASSRASERTEEAAEPEASAVPVPTADSLPSVEAESPASAQLHSNPVKHSPSASTEANPESRQAPDARELLDRANAARRTGAISDAARDYEALLSAYPADARAGLAAFELGRLRMDRLGDLNGAVSALRRAVQLAPGSGFREDAMARLVLAYAALGSMDRCKQARDAYLSAYPHGVHTATVSRKCD